MGLISDIAPRFQRDISSVGLERCLDRAEVTGSNPVYPTFSTHIPKFFFLVFGYCAPSVRFGYVNRTIPFVWPVGFLVVG